MIRVDLVMKKAVDAHIVFLPKGQTHALLSLKSLEAGEIFPVKKDQTLWLFFGIGSLADLSLTQIRIYVRQAFQNPFLKKLKTIAITPHHDDSQTIKAIIEGYLLGHYLWTKYKSGENDKQEQDITIIAKPSPLYEDCQLICRGVNLTRDLVNDNADTVNADYLEKKVKSIIAATKNTSCVVLNEKDLKKHGLNLHLAVNQGSNKEPKLILVHYKGGKPQDPLLAIVGKGMTFDTGGLNLKPTGSIETMKIDMAGAASVCGILHNAIELKVKKNILFVLGIAENAIGPGAYKPGDVFTGYAGKSVEIGNTDAEGRLVLADAFAFIKKNYNPAMIIDLATLTGACVVALGFDYTGLFSNHLGLSQKLLQIAQVTDDRAWSLPLYPEMKEYIKSPIADLKNTSNVKGGGACTAATFLHQFIGDTPWAHLDIAGTSFVEGQQRFYFAHGGTGAGVRLLTHFIIEPNWPI